MGPTRGVAQEAWGRREDGTDPPIRRLSSLIKAWPGVPMAPNMLTGMIMRRMRSGKGPYSVSLTAVLRHGYVCSQACAVSVVSGYVGGASRVKGLNIDERKGTRPIEVFKDYVRDVAQARPWSLHELI